ncbi:MAG: hypothetical protein IH597_10080 [Bacteroidales bacterium]|nr:hypothetical protein [Bacteroidales bacterium]
MDKLFFNKLFGLTQKVTNPPARRAGRSRLNKNSLNTTSGFGRAARTVPQHTFVLYSFELSPALCVLLALSPP